ncbi:MAG: S24 family peptidase [Algibacter sp.]|uniref:S24 family peptidase n=1 Tax=Algibacter sp. TaxID=1872428 RepID=UPI0026294F53|nr:S24 family peptidase [Algibacter sp.]MDG1731156.1 S24 family peptidase [Algibacter sp.]MDG2178061.1 S24 family peptidase [Algibacter sp.]
MKSPQAHQIKKSKKNYRVVRPIQTGFSSPATHYTEPRIDLNDVLIENASSSFYVRVIDDSFSDFNIFKNDVLIIDKALTPKKNQLVIVIQDEAFKIVRIEHGSTTKLQIWGVITYIIKSVL